MAEAHAHLRLGGTCSTTNLQGEYLGGGIEKPQGSEPPHTAPACPIRASHRDFPRLKVWVDDSMKAQQLGIGGANLALLLAAQPAAADTFGK